MKRTLLIVGILLTGFFILTVLAAAGYYVYTLYREPTEPPRVPPTTATNTEEIVAFTSAEDFGAYLDKAEDLSETSGSLGIGALGLGGGFGMDMAFETFEAPLMAPSEVSATRRVSETNVQVAGIDEPDIVKTDGSNIYLAEDYVYRMIDPFFIMESEELSIDGYNPTTSEYGTKIIEAFPPQDLQELVEVPANGDLLLYNETLVVIGDDGLIAYDVSVPDKPTSAWNLQLGEGTGILSARLMDGTVYLVTRDWIDSYDPCPIQPLFVNGEALQTVACTDIYHPDAIVPIDVTYTVFKIDAETGEQKDFTSFVGSDGSSVLYMSQDNLYITYTYPDDVTSTLLDFLVSLEDLLPTSVRSDLQALESYDISQSSKVNEISVILDEYYYSLTPDEKTKLENEVENAWAEFEQDYVRQFETTGIAKISTDNLSFDAVGSIPGEPLNQFSLDEYEGNLRVATTSGDGWWGMWGSSLTSVNDVYVLNDNMETIGSIEGLGLDESIYSVRFIGDAGYVVTFRQVDPFYVVDLSNPGSPVLKGELKIPGYSSYLHELMPNVILGVGEEDGEVKLSLFNVENPQNPVEMDKYQLDEYWSDIEETHHAFLLDKDHKAFFIPGSSAGYIFTYEKDGIALEKVVTDIQAQRALYIDDYLYVIGSDSIVVLDEGSWERSAELELTQ